MIKSKFKKTAAAMLALLTVLSALVFAPSAAEAAEVVTVAKSKTYNYFDGVGNYYNVTFYMPKININSADVNKINSEIRGYCNRVFDEEDYNKSEALSMGVIKMDYSYVVKNGVLSLLIDIVYSGGAYHVYHVYNVNRSTGKIMSNNEVAAAFSTTYANAKNAVKWTIKDKFYHLSSMKNDDFTIRQRNRSISASNLNATQVYAGANGLHALYSLYWIAGAEHYIHPTTVYNPSSPSVSVNAENSGAKISWSKLAGVPKYRVYKKVNGAWKKLGDSTGTSYVDKSAKAGGTYTYTVRGISADGGAFMSGFSAGGKTIKVLSAPKLSKLEATAGGLKLSWGRVNGAAKYRVYQMKNGGWKSIGEVTGCSCDLSGMTSGTTYKYTVRAISSDLRQFMSGYDNSGKSQKFVATPSISKISNTPGGVSLSWNKPKGAEKFRVYRKTGSGSWQKLADTAATSYRDGTAKNGTKYSYTVRCVSSNAKSFQSYYSTSGKTITCKR